MKNKTWSGRPDRTDKQVVYSYHKKSGRYGFIEAISHDDARQYIGSDARIYRRDLEHTFYCDAMFDDAYLKAIFYGATTKNEADMFITGQEINRIKQ